jgi:hypothetical protein
MSIYATLAHFGIKRFGDKAIIEILVQSVPAHIEDTGPMWDFLPPPVDPEGKISRAVFFVEPGEEKGTDRCGQEYVRPLLMLTGKEYREIRFIDLMFRLEEALDRRYGPRPAMMFYKPDGSEERIP